MIEKIKNKLRNIYNKKNRKNLKNKDFSVIASNCNGAFILHDLGLRFNSPFVNLWMRPDEFVKFLSNMKHYLSCDMSFITEKGIDYPIGVLEDVRIYFQHYKTEEEAKEKWVTRSKRINFDNLFIMFTDRDGCTYENLRDFDKLPYKNKVVFTNKPYKEFKSTFYLKGFEKDNSVGMCYKYKNRFSIKKHYDDFNYVEWFNKGSK